MTEGMTLTPDNSTLTIDRLSTESSGNYQREVSGGQLQNKGPP